MRRAGPWAIFFALAVALLVPIQGGLSARKPPRPSALLYTPDRRLMKIVSCGHGATLADLVWVQSMNYVLSEFKSGKTHIEHLDALFHVITELDPNFVDAYVMGAIFLSSIAQEPERSLELLEKGQGRLTDDGTRVAEDPGHPGRVHPEHHARWKLLHEAAATHLVTVASFATTPEERFESIRAAGRHYVFGAARYPRERYPDRPEWFEDAARLATRKFDPRDRSQAELARYIWTQRFATSPPGSALHKIAARRLSELDARAAFELLERATEDYRRRYGPPPSIEALEQPTGPLPRIPADPLGTGWFLVQGRVVAPALDAAVLERTYQSRIAEFRHRNDRPPASLEELRAAFAGTKLALPEPPAWVRLEYTGGELRASPDVSGLREPR